MPIVVCSAVKLPEVLGSLPGALPLYASYYCILQEGLAYSFPRKMCLPVAKLSRQEASLSAFSASMYVYKTLCDLLNDAHAPAID